MPKVHTMSQVAAEQFAPNNAAALISIITPKLRSIEYGQPNLTNWSNCPVAQVSFHDADPKKHDDRAVRLMTIEDARILIAFAQLNKDREMYVHCYQGLSRSNATARFLSDVLGFELGFCASAQIMNRHVYSTLLKTYEQMQ